MTMVLVLESFHKGSNTTSPGTQNQMKKEFYQTKVHENSHHNIKQLTKTTTTTPV